MDKLEKDEDEFVLDDSKDDLEAEVTVEDEGPEFSHFEDDEEFVGYNDKDDAEEFMNEKKPTRSAKASQPLQYANVPLHLRSNWENYCVEILMVLGMQINMAFWYNWNWYRYRYTFTYLYRHIGTYLMKATSNKKN